MARRTRIPKRKLKHKVRVNLQQAPKVPKEVVASEVYWPDRIDYVKAIAARGLNDDEMAAYLGVSPALFDSWKAYYPLLSRAIDEGRTKADAEVVAALHKTAVGYDYDTQEVVRGRGGSMVLDVTKHVPGDVQAQKFWLSNRSSHWNAGQNLNVGGQGRDKPLHVSAETKVHVIHSILNMITPRPDGDGKPPRILNVDKS
jgi:hypothetical protein